MTGTEDDLVFEGRPDSGNPITPLISLMAIAMFSAALVAAGLGVRLDLTNEGVLLILVISVVATLQFAWILHRVSRVAVRVSPDGVTAETGGSKLSFLLADIESCAVASQGSSWLRILLSRRSPEYVKIRLRKRMRYPLVGHLNADSARKFGFPTSKDVALYVADPHGLVDAIQARSA
jgi:hypothetical protein